MVALSRRTVLYRVAFRSGSHLPRPKLFFAMLTIGLIGPNIGRIALWESGPSLPLYFRTDLRFDSIMWGAITATILRHRYNIPNPNVIGALALIAFLVLARFNLLSNGFLYQGGYALSV